MEYPNAAARSQKQLDNGQPAKASTYSCVLDLVASLIQ
jgi:hypothetical protein